MTIPESKIKRAWMTAGQGSTPIRPPATFPHRMGEGSIKGALTRGGGCYRALAPGWYGVAPFGAYGGFAINWKHVTALRAQ